MITSYTYFKAIIGFKGAPPYLIPTTNHEVERVGVRAHFTNDKTEA